MATTALTIITNALIELGAYSQGEALSASDAQFGLQKLEDLLDEWNARSAYIFNQVFALFTLTPNHSPNLIGPGLSSPDFAASQRPVKIVSASIVLQGQNPTTDIPINVRDDAWWAQNQVKQLTSSLPTDLYYSPDWPNGSIYLWPIPTAVNQVRLQYWGVLTQVSALTDVFSFPPGYRKAITLSLAEDMANGFERQVSPTLAQKAMKARTAVQGNNDGSPRIQSVDFGMPGSSKNTGDFNYVSGLPINT